MIRNLPVGLALSVFAFCHFSLASATESNLTIYVYPPSHKLDWDSPHELLRSFLGSELAKIDDNAVEFQDEGGLRRSLDSNYRSTMGHTIAHIGCVLPDGKPYDTWVSFSGEDYAAVDKDLALNQKIGLGLLHHDYIDGHIIAGEENKKRLIHYINDNPAKQPRFMVFPVDKKKCADLAEMAEFFKAFNKRFLKPDGTAYAEKAPYSQLQAIEKARPWDNLRFNTQDPFEGFYRRKKDPHYIVGGGCAPFGAALVKQAGMYDYYYFDIYWRRKVTYSERLVGEPGKREVSALQILAGLEGNNWTYDGWPNYELNMYDPTKIWIFVGEIQKCLTDINSCDAGVRDWIKSRGYKIARAEPQVFSGSYVFTRKVSSPSKSPGSKDRTFSETRTRTVNLTGVVISK